jgi:hypothetical protein
MALPIFHRPELAAKLAERIISDKGASGIFLAALRRTGKSTFIREDLAPLLRQRGTACEWARWCTGVQVHCPNGSGSLEESVEEEATAATGRDLQSHLTLTLRPYIVKLLGGEHQCSKLIFI